MRAFAPVHISDAGICLSYSGGGQQGPLPASEHMEMCGLGVSNLLETSRDNGGTAFQEILCPQSFGG